MSGDPDFRFSACQRVVFIDLIGDAELELRRIVDHIALRNRSRKDEMPLRLIGILPEDEAADYRIGAVDRQICEVGIGRVCFQMNHKTVETAEIKPMYRDIIIAVRCFAQDIPGNIQFIGSCIRIEELPLHQIAVVPIRNRGRAAGCDGC